MALGKTKNNATRNTILYSVKYKGKDKETGGTTFAVSRAKKDSKEFEPVDNVQDISGTLVGVEPREFEYQGNKIKTVSVYVRDGDEFYSISFPFGIATRALFNSLISLKIFEDISIGVYMTKPKKEGAKSYPAISLRQNDVRVDWKYQLADLPKVEEVKFQGKLMRDYTAVNDFFSEQLKELDKAIKLAPKHKEVAEQVNQASQATPPTVEDVGDDKDVPFN